MKLYAIPFACSLAPHLALRESGLQFELAWVTRHTLALEDGGSLLAINPKGKVPTLVLDDGAVMTEVPAVLLTLAQLAPQLSLVPADMQAPQRHLEWLVYLGTELHKAVLSPGFDPEVPAAMKALALERGRGVLAHLDRALEGRPFLLGEQRSAADLYLFWALMVVPSLGIDLAESPALAAFRDRLTARPSVRELLSIEGAAYRRSQGGSDASVHRSV